MAARAPPIPASPAMPSRTEAAPLPGLRPTAPPGEPADGEQPVAAWKVRGDGGFDRPGSGIGRGDQEETTFCDGYDFSGIAYRGERDRRSAQDAGRRSQPATGGRHPDHPDASEVLPDALMRDRRSATSRRVTFKDLHYLEFFCRVGIAHQTRMRPNSFHATASKGSAADGTWADRLISACTPEGLDTERS